VAHPGLIPLAKQIFDSGMPGPNQISRIRDDIRITADDLLRVPAGPVTEKGVRQNINVGILYLEAWLGGLGCVPLYNLMEDAATAEISRTQLWQWIHHGARLDDGRVLTPDLYRTIRDEEAPPDSRAASLFDQLILSDTLEDFLTIPAYEELLRVERTS
jgi:malate synthase